MKRAAIISLALMLFCGLLNEPADSQTISINEDSLRAAIVRLIEKGQILENDYNKTNMDSALFLFDSAATMAVSKFGKNDTLYIRALLSQANNRVRTGEWNRVCDLAKKALNNIDAAQVSNAELRLEALNKLAYAYVQITDFINGMEISEEIINTINKYETKTKSHKELLIKCRARIATCRLQQGDLSYKNFEFSKSTLELIEENYGSDSRTYASAYHNLGYYLLFMRKFDEAEGYIYKGDSLVKKIFPPEDPNSTFSSIMVMLYYIARGRLSEADSLLQREFEIVNRTFGREHVHYPLLVRRQAQLLLAKDSLDMAIEKMREVVKIYRDRFGHPTMMLIQALRLLGKIGFVAGNNGVYNQATDELAEVKHTYLFNAFRYASESLKLSYVRRYPVLESILFSGIVNNSKPEIVSSAVEMVLNGKGLAFDAMAAQHAAALCADDPYLDSLLVEHIRISDRIAGMVMASRATSAETLIDLFSRKDQIESEISSFCADIGFAEVRERVKVGEILKSLPDNSVFLDFVKYEYYDYEKHYPYGQDSMYAAIVYAPGRQVEVIGLGYSGEIESLISMYHEVMADALAGQLRGSNDQLMIDYANVAHELYQRLVAPLPPFVGSTEKIFICTDGIINLLPFETL
ncbi:MAG: tetratricopeptide repeat protein, partial [Planctomycetota bacterium]